MRKYGDSKEEWSEKEFRKTNCRRSHLTRVCMRESRKDASLAFGVMGRTRRI